MAKREMLNVGTCVRLKDNSAYGKITFNLPIEYFDKIHSLESEMELNIHNLVWKYGKKKETRKYGTQYSLNVNIVINDSKGITKRIRKITISNPEKCQRMGHLWLTDENKNDYGFNELVHQEFNVYSGVFNQINN